MSDFVIHFWGVRGTIPTTGTDFARYGGNTSCAEFRCGEHRLIFDAGTGIRLLGDSLKLDEADIFLSHTHIDHIIGLPVFAPFYSGGKFRIWAGHLKPESNIKSAISQMMQPPLFPLTVNDWKASVEWHDFAAGTTLEPANLAGIKIQTFALSHPDRATAYRVEYNGKAACYVTDVEHCPDSPDKALIDFISGADILIYDSTYSDEEFSNFIGWGHSTWQEATRLAKAAGVAKCALFHHDPAKDDTALDAIAAKITDSSIFHAREGMEIKL